MQSIVPIVVFVLDLQRFALPLGCVERAVRAVEVTPLPKAPEIVCGIVNVQGRIVPVISLRRRLGISDRQLALGDHLLIVHSPRWALAMIVDTVLGVDQCAEHDIVAGTAVLPGAAHLKGIAKLDGGMVLIQDLDSFLSLDEAGALAQALENRA